MVVSSTLSNQYATKLLKKVQIPLTGCVQKAGLVAGVVDPLLAVHGGVGQSSDFIPGSVPVVDISYVRPVD